MKQTPQRDTIYAARRDRVEAFVFDERVVQVFSDMIARSVPGYAEVLRMTEWLASLYVQPETRLYDLGCSLGDSTMAMAGVARRCRGEVVAVDNAPAMVEACLDRVTQANLAPFVSVNCEDIRETRIERASVVVLNYTLQFISPDERGALLTRIIKGMVDGAALIVSEKIAFEDREEQQRMIDLHHAFKRANGYSDLEISQKRAALENILIPDTLAGHRLRLEEAGFREVSTWFQCLNFASLLAIK